MTRRMAWTTGAALLGAVVTVPTGLTAQRNCEFRDEIELTGRAPEWLQVYAGAGKLVIRGRDRDRRNPRRVITDGSGSIEVRAVGGTVRIDGAGSGSVTVRDVDGDLVVTDTRRSRIRYSDIRGVLDLPPGKRGG